MKKFRIQKGEALIEHLESQKENVNLDKDDNLNSVFLTLGEICYLQRCLKATLSVGDILKEMNVQIKHHREEENEPAMNSMLYIKSLVNAQFRGLKGGKFKIRKNGQGKIHS